MTARVTGVNAEGWWVLRPVSRRIPPLVLPTWMLPRTVKYTDRVRLVRSCGTVGFWRVVQIVTRLRSHYGRPKAQRMTR